MFTVIEEELLTRDLGSFNTQHLANMAWAFVVLEHSRFHKMSQSGVKLLQRVLDVASRRIDEFALEELRQLGQVTLATRDRGSEERESGFALLVKDALRKHHGDQEIACPTSSQLHLQVASSLESLGLPVHNEVKVFEGVYHIDIVLGAGDPEDGSNKVAVEVDGPTHFVQNTRQPTPHTSLKRWLLSREGYAVVSVPFFEWQSYQLAEEHKSYLVGKLREVGWDMRAMAVTA
eukprot:CAMPEP_0172081662 /NCGR_PEP_ID=MMETSP1043-20130122/19429_1 /TAXON_ID=464988 /ORGANISM="Hemiselmis andersenii, Strain CCMP441" /LENGTH=232 /DNA_ID=CAMNT_0012743133 /DNA_START=1 /DNA_END=697 /DNA_ORIENTATION=+